MSRPLHGTVDLPGSKSESNRALMIAAYGGFPPAINHLSDAHDTVLLKALLSSTLPTVDCEDAGTVARFLLTYLSGIPGSWRLTGTERLCQRPMAPLIDALRQLGASVTTEGGKNTIATIIGHPLQGGAATLDASQSSQFASSLLMAAPTWERGLRLTLTGVPVSMPYLEMTIRMMAHFGVQVGREGHTFIVDPQTYRPCPFMVSADWSAASYWYEMLAVSDGGELLLKGLRADALQGDAVVAEWFKPLGITTVFEPEGARIAKTAAHPHNLVFDFTDHPDLFPAVCATCFALGVNATFKGTDTLSAKESDRMTAMKAELAKIGHSEVLCAHHDHRIAMALAALWPVFGPVTLDDPTVVSKSYPGFWTIVLR